ncbi:MAG: amidohydrolase family protein, partial [Myxococcota bacterium]
AHEGAERHRIGVDKLLWGSDYPHMEGTWPNTMDSLRATFGSYPEDETRRILGTNAAEVYGFDLEALAPIAEKFGPALSDITAEA